MLLTDIEAAERREALHLLSSDFGGRTTCDLDASTVHWTADSLRFDCPACARAFVCTACFNDDPKNCPAAAHARAAGLAYPTLVAMEGGKR